GAGTGPLSPPRRRRRDRTPLGGRGPELRRHERLGEPDPAPSGPVEHASRPSRKRGVLRRHRRQRSRPRASRGGARGASAREVRHRHGAEERAEADRKHGSRAPDARPGLRSRASGREHPGRRRERRARNTSPARFWRTTKEEGMRQAADLNPLFRRVFELCNVQEGEIVGLLTDPTTWPEYRETAAAAAQSLGAQVFEISVPGLGWDTPTPVKGMGAGVPALAHAGPLLDAISG